MRYNKINLFFHKNLIPTGFGDIFRRIHEALNKFSYDSLINTVLPGSTIKLKVIPINPKPIVDRANYVVKKMKLNMKLQSHSDASSKIRKKEFKQTVREIDPHFDTNPDYTMFMIEQTLKNQELKNGLLTEYNKLYQPPFENIREYYTDGNLRFGFINKELCFWHKDLLNKQEVDLCYNITLSDYIYIDRVNFHSIMFVTNINKEDYDSIKTLIYS